MSETTPPEPEQLAEAVRSLSGTVDALRADVKRIGSTGPLPTDETQQADHSWVTTVTVPAPRRPAVPRFLLEAIFLVSCAVAAAVASLDALVIAAVMAGAWVLVALIEWAASRADRYEEELIYAPPPVPTAPTAPVSDPAWFSPPVEQTMLAVDEAGATAVTRLPPRIADPEETMEHRSGDLLEDTSASIADERPH
jgi:hypothetical protein